MMTTYFKMTVSSSTPSARSPLTTTPSATASSKVLLGGVPGDDLLGAAGTDSLSAPPDLLGVAVADGVVLVLVDHAVGGGRPGVDGIELDVLLTPMQVVMDIEAVLEVVTAVRYNKWNEGVKRRREEEKEQEKEHKSLTFFFFFPIPIQQTLPCQEHPLCHTSRLG